jgi:glutamine synthetase
LLLALSFLLVFAAAAIADPDAVPETARPSTASDGKPSKPSEAKKLPKPAEPVPNAATMSPAEIREKSDTYLRQCLNDWDAATHMTRKEWQRTCRRITDERAKFLIEQMGK